MLCVCVCVCVCVCLCVCMHVFRVHIRSKSSLESDVRQCSPVSLKEHKLAEKELEIVHGCSPHHGHPGEYQSLIHKV